MPNLMASPWQRKETLEKILRASTSLMLEGWSPTPGSDSRRSKTLGTKAKGKFNDLVTRYDTAMEKFVGERLRTAFPGEAVYGEELFAAAAKKGKAPELAALKAFWIIDPIDGTVNYSRGYPYFCVTAAYLEKNKSGKFQALAGATWNPLTQEMFSAARGEGAWLNRQRLRVSNIKHPEQALICTGFAHVRQGRLDPQMMTAVTRCIGKTLGIRRDGSAALDFAYLAAGRFDAFIEKGLAPWDTAAGVLLLQEAGGHITDFAGKYFDPVAPHQEILASNGPLHGWIKKQLKKR